jgi:hypothetical protein
VFNFWSLLWSWLLSLCEWGTSYYNLAFVYFNGKHCIGLLCFGSGVKSRNC